MSAETAAVLLWDTAPTGDVTRVRSEATAAEQAGFNGFWISETRHDPMVQAAVAATATSAITIGTNIAVAFARNPMAMAVAANDVQLLSGGRFILGLGSQVRPHIERRFGMPWSHPTERMAEFVGALRSIWQSWRTGAALSFEGRFYRHTLMTPMFDPGPNPHGPPPVFLAAVGPGMTEVAGRCCDGFLAHSFTTTRYLHEVTLPALQRGRSFSDLPGPVDLCGCPFVVTGRTDAEIAAAIAGVRRRLSFYGSTPAYQGVLALHGWTSIGARLHELSREQRWKEMVDVVPDEMVEEFAVVAEPSQVLTEVNRRFGTEFGRVQLAMPYRHGAEMAAVIR